MTTSRTGTAQWKNLRRRVLAKAKRTIKHCPNCKVELDYTQGQRPNSAEVDHIIPHSMGGKDVMSNCAILCRFCNASKGNRDVPRPTVEQPKTSRSW
jgi:5-methylcytosine-specific restriction endonuclease McrA